MDATEAVEHLLCDPKLSDLCEILKIGDDILDVITLSENQHSDFLAWMFDPREGHGQGDQILRDLLMSACEVAADVDCRLDGRGTTAKFFSEWPPSRIRTASFGSVFTARELGMKASERVDLFVIDPMNKFVLLIENKAGTTHSQPQLDGYRASWQEALANNPHLKEYSSVFIALDREFDFEEGSDRPSTSYWLHLGYEWLKASADRALLHVERGNAAARLVVSYCNRQTDWESPTSQRAIKLAAELHGAHGVAVKHLLESSPGRLEKRWVENRLSDHTLFMLQNKAALGLLRDTQGMAGIKEILMSRLPGFKRDYIGHARAWLDACPPGWERYTGDYGWPVYFKVTYSDGSKAKYDLSLIMNAGNANTDEEEALLRERLQRFDVRFNKHQGTERRRVSLNKDLTLLELMTRLGEYSARLISA
ncbi:PD-(D/E)XK nuclease family protein [Pseudomonas sp. RC10]|uniref:PDDEXK-like family protein n=1 Tax=Pseudomonas bambusae TaxID=3139142 RepID=UPI003138C78B